MMLVADGTAAGSSRIPPVGGRLGRRSCASTTSPTATDQSSAAVWERRC